MLLKIVLFTILVGMYGGSLIMLVSGIGKGEIVLSTVGMVGAVLSVVFTVILYFSKIGNV